MTTQVDWNWQIINRPNLGNVLLANSSSTVTYGANTVTFDNSAGIGTDSTGFVTLNLASLTQEGNIGTVGGQQLMGPLFLCLPGSIGHSTPTHWSNFNSAVIQDGRLAWYSSAEGNSSAPQTYISYFGSGTPVWQLVCNGNVDIFGGYTAGIVNIQNATGNAALLLYPTGTASQFQSPTGLLFKVGTAGTLAAWPLPIGGSVEYFDINPDAGKTAAFSISSGTYKGKYGTLGDGSTVSGGIVTAIGGGGGGSSVTMSGDVTGASSSNTLVKIQGNAVSASSPTLNQYLQWNGSDWIPAAGSATVTIGQPVSGGTPGDTLMVDGSGNLGQWVPYVIERGGGSASIGTSGQITIQPATGQPMYLYGESSSDYLRFWSSNEFDGVVNGVQWLLVEPGVLELWPGLTNNLFMQQGGPTALAGVGGAQWRIDASGNLIARPGSGAGWGVFGATPVVQQANASQANITAVLDPNAQAALQAIYNLLLAYGWAPATP